MTSPLDTLLQSGIQTDGARQVFERLAQLENTPAQTLDARSYEVDDRLLNTEPMFGQGGVNASGLTRLDGGLPHNGAAALEYGANGLGLGTLPAEISGAAPIGGVLARAAGPALDAARSGIGGGGSAAGGLPALNIGHEGSIVTNNLQALQSDRGGSGGGTIGGGITNLTQIINNNGNNNTGAPGHDGQDGHGNDGQNGHDGHDGLPGLPGLSGLPGLPGLPGTKGGNGHNGNNGHDGHNGHNGSDHHGHGGHHAGGEDCDSHHHGNHDHNHNSHDHDHGQHGGTDCGCDSNGNIITQIIDHTAGAITQIWPGVDQSVASFVDHTAGAVNTIWSSIDNSVTNIIAGVDTLTGNTLGGVNQTITTVADAGSSVGNTVTSVLGDSTTIINQSILQPIVETLQPVVAGVPGLLEQVVANAGTVINETLPDIVDSSLTTLTQAGVNNILSQVVTTADTAVNDTVPELVNTLLASLQNNGHDLNIGSVAANVSELVEQLPAPTITNELPQLAETILGNIPASAGQILNIDLSLNLDHNPATPLAEVGISTVGDLATTPILDVMVEPALSSVIEPVLAVVAPVVAAVDSQVVVPLANDIITHNVDPVLSHVVDWNAVPVLQAIEPTVASIADPIAGAAAAPIVNQLVSDIVDHNVVPIVGAMQSAVDSALPSIDLHGLADAGRVTLTDFVNDTPPIQNVVTLEPLTVVFHTDNGVVATVAPVIQAAGVLTSLDSGAIVAPASPADNGVHLDSHTILGALTAPASGGDLALSTIGATATSGAGTAATLDTVAHGIGNVAGAIADNSWLTAGNNAGHASVTSPVAEPIHIDLGHSAHHWL